MGVYLKSRKNLEAELSNGFVHIFPKTFFHKIFFFTIFFLNVRTTLINSCELGLGYITSMTGRLRRVFKHFRSLIA